MNFFFRLISVLHNATFAKMEPLIFHEWDTKAFFAVYTLNLSQFFFLISYISIICGVVYSDFFKEFKRVKFVVCSINSNQTTNCKKILQGVGANYRQVTKKSNKNCRKKVARFGLNYFSLSWRDFSIDPRRIAVRFVPPPMPRSRPQYIQTILAFKECWGCLPNRSWARANRVPNPSAVRPCSPRLGVLSLALALALMCTYVQPRTRIIHGVRVHARKLAVGNRESVMNPEWGERE